MNGWQIATLILVVTFGSLTWLLYLDVGSDDGQAMPMSGILFWSAAISTVAGLTFL